MATEINSQSAHTQLLHRLYAQAIATLASMDAAETRDEAERLLTSALLRAYVDGAEWGLSAMEHHLGATVGDCGGTPS